MAAGMFYNLRKQGKTLHTIVTQTNDTLFELREDSAPLQRHLVESGIISPPELRPSIEGGAPNAAPESNNTTPKHRFY